MKLALALTATLFLASAGFAAETPDLTKGNVTVTVTSAEYGTGQPVTFIMACTHDSRTTGFLVYVNFVNGVGIIPAVLPVATPIPSLWAACGVAVIAVPKATIASVDVSELQENRQSFILIP